MNTAETLALEPTKPNARKRRRYGLGICLSAALTATLAMPLGAQAKSIPDGRGMDKAVDFYGHVAVPKPIALPIVPQNPFMANNGESNIHNDSYMTDSYRWAGPLGNHTKVSSVVAKGECASITFDSKGRIVAVCLLKHAYLTLMDPKTLAITTQLMLPENTQVSGFAASPNAFAADYTELAGGYFYLNNRDQAVVSTATRHIITYAVKGVGSKAKFVKIKDFNLQDDVASTDIIQSALPDFEGNVWFITKDGVVGVLNPSTGVIKTKTLTGESITNSFAMGQDGGVYIVSTKSMYRFDIATDGSPSLTWSRVYPNSGSTIKPGQKSIGSGTTPTIMSRGRVAIVDNANPEHIVVYHTKKAAIGRSQEICRARVFTRNASATENSLIAVGDALIVENNYGNLGPQTTTLGRTTKPGMARVDVSSDGKCTTKWVNSTVSAPSVVPKFSAATGLVYTYSKPKGPGTIDRWYWTALDFRTGKLVYSKLAGTGALFNNNYASLYVGANGDGYVGVTAGLVRLHDGI